MDRIDLTDEDIDYIGRVVETEVPQSVARRDPGLYRDMVGAVVDTMTNRLSTGRYGASIEALANKRNQFTAINGPRRPGRTVYGSVAKAPKANALTQSAVAEHLGGRALGRPSEIGGSLDYANPNFSDAKNIDGWIGPMIDAGARKIGVGTDVHYHGLAPHNRTRAARAYDVSLPKGYAPGTIGPFDERQTPYPSNLAYRASPRAPENVPIPTARVAPTTQVARASPPPAAPLTRIAGTPPVSAYAATPPSTPAARAVASAITPSPAARAPAFATAPQASTPFSKTTMDRVQEQNLATRMATPSPAPRQAASTPTPAARPSPYAGAPQMAAQRPSSPAPTVAGRQAPAPAPARSASNFAGTIGSPRSLEGIAAATPIAERGQRLDIASPARPQTDLAARMAGFDAPAGLAQQSIPQAALGRIAARAAPAPAAAPTTNFAGPAGSFRSLQAPSPIAERGSRVAPPPPMANVPTPTSRQAAMVGNTLADRMAGAPLSFGWDQGPLAQEHVDRYAATRPSRAPAPQTRQALASIQEENLASRLGPAPAAPTRQVQPSMVGRIAQTASSLIGPTPAAAAEMPASSRRPAAGFAGAAGSPRSLEAPSYPTAPVSRPASPAGQAESVRSIEPRRAAPMQPPASAPALTSAPRATPAPAPQPIAEVARAPSVPTSAPRSRVGAAPGSEVEDAWSGLRTVTEMAAAPQTRNPIAGAIGGLGGLGGIAGSVLGSVVGGPLGGLVGNFVGRQVQGRQAAARQAMNGIPTYGGPTTGLERRASVTPGSTLLGRVGSSGGRSAPSASPAGKASSGRSSASSRRSFSGFGDRDSAVGPDGGKSKGKGKGGKGKR